jgi:hypothetical protein
MRDAWVTLLAWPILDRCIDLHPPPGLTFRRCLLRPPALGKSSGTTASSRSAPAAWVSIALMMNSSSAMSPSKKTLALARLDHPKVATVYP